MDHVAIMKKSWGLTDKILSGQKKIESRWYFARYRPWDGIKKGETVYFKNSGEPVKIQAKVRKIVQFADLTPGKVKKILEKYGKEDGIERENISEFVRRFKHKKYCILIFLERPIAAKPFEINKTGFGAMSAWITVGNITKIKSHCDEKSKVIKIRTPDGASV